MVPLRRLDPSFLFYPRPGVQGVTRACPFVLPARERAPRCWGVPRGTAGERNRTESSGCPVTTFEHPGPGGESGLCVGLLGAGPRTALRLRPFGVDVGGKTSLERGQRVEDDAVAQAKGYRLRGLVTWSPTPLPGFHLVSVRVLPTQAMVPLRRLDPSFLFYPRPGVQGVTRACPFVLPARERAPRCWGVPRGTVGERGAPRAQDARRRRSNIQSRGVRAVSAWTFLGLAREPRRDSDPSG